MRLCAQTSIMAVEFNGGVVMGADSRTTTGYARWLATGASRRPPRSRSRETLLSPDAPRRSYIANRVTDKLTPIAPRIFCCRSGSAADTQAVADLVQNYVALYGLSKGEDPTVYEAASMFKRLCYRHGRRLAACCCRAMAG